MRPAYRPGTRPRLLWRPRSRPWSCPGWPPDAAVAPAYCTAAANLKTSVSNLGNVDVAKNGLGSLQTALNNVTSDAHTFAADAKSAFAPHTTALQKSLSGLKTAIKSPKSQPSLTAASAVASSVTQVKNPASALQSAVSGSGKC